MNGVDCGVFVIQFVHQILKPHMTSTTEDIRTIFSSFFSDFHFSENDADMARRDFADEVADLTGAFRSYKKTEEANRDRRRTERLSVAEGAKKVEVLAEAAQESDVSDENDDAAEIVVARVGGKNDRNVEENAGAVSVSAADLGLVDQNIPPDSRGMKKGYEERGI
jgi:hypothetical protein